MQTEKVQWEAVGSAYDRLTESERQEKPEALVPTLASIISEEAESLVSLEKIGAYTERLGSTLATSSRGHAFFNGKHFDVDDVGALTLWFLFSSC